MVCCTGPFSAPANRIVAVYELSNASRSAWRADRIARGSNASTDSHFKPRFSPIGTLSLAPRSVNRVKILSRPAVSCTILPFAASDFPQIRTPARAHAEPTPRLWLRPDRVCVSSRLKKIEPPRRCPWRGAGRCKVEINNQNGGRCSMTVNGRERRLPILVESRPWEKAGFCE